MKRAQVEAWLQARADRNAAALLAEVRAVAKDVVDLREELDGTKARQEAEALAFQASLRALTRAMQRVVDGLR